MSSQFDLIVDHSKENLREIPTDVLETTNLKMLFLEGNKLQSLPEDLFHVLPKLMWLDLRNNLLTSFPRSVAYHKHLENLLLTNNRIQELPNELGLVPNLKVLQVGDNPLVYPIRKVVSEGTKSIKKYLKQQYERLHPGISTDPQGDNNKLEKQEETVLRVIDEYSKPLLEENKQNSSTSESGSFNKRTDKKGKIRNRNDDSSSSSKSNNTKKHPPTQKLRTDKLVDSKHLQPALHVKKLDTPHQTKNKQPTEALKIVHNIHKQGSKISLKSYFSPNVAAGKTAARVIDKSLKEGWMNKLRILLEDQERILQQERNLNAISTWRHKKNQETPQSRQVSEDNSSIKSDPPFAVYPEYTKMPTREELTTQLQSFLDQKDVTTANQKHDIPVINIEKLLNDMIEQLREMEQNQSRNPQISPRTQMDQTGKQIQAIMNIHKKLLQLKAANDQSC